MEVRRKAITDYINGCGNVSFAQLKKQFPDVSEMTLRTDLKYLDEEKLIVRIHGGARSVQVVIGTDDYFNVRMQRSLENKQLIARKAADLVKKDAVIYIDSGSTTTSMAKIMPDQSDIIYTSGISCAIEMARLEKANVNIPGGKLNRYSMSVCGVDTYAELSNISFDQVFMGTTAFSEEAGFTCGDKSEAIVKQMILEKSGQVIMLMDSSKIGKVSTFRFGDLRNVDVLVSDDRLPEEFIKKCKSENITII